jgi:HSP20 family protein
MALISWRGKHDGEHGELMPVVALDRLFDTLFREPFGALDWGNKATGWSPAIDVVEDEKEVTVRAELPGIDPKELDISVVGNELSLRGEKRESCETKEKGVYHSETRYGSFHRTIQLPEGVDSENVDAKYSSGILTLRIPKIAPIPTKKIEVKVE